MNSEIVTANPAAKAVISGVAPRTARLAAAKGHLPLPLVDFLEVLAFLSSDEDPEIAESARETFRSQPTGNLLTVVSNKEVAGKILSFVAENDSFDRKVYESVITNSKTPDEAILKFARKTSDASLLELVTVNQQRLIRTPEILDAVFSNPAASAEATRRVQETKQEFFEKKRGAEQVAAELRAKGNTAAAEFIEQAEFAVNLNESDEEPDESGFTFEDMLAVAEHIEVPDTEIDDSWLALELIEELYAETEEHRRAVAEKIISQALLDDNIAPERVALIRRILMMPIKDRVKLAMKGDREARNVLIRDPNRIVAQAVLSNPRITENEVERISAMRTVPGEVLRQIEGNRIWARNYVVIHNLVRNPRTPLPTVLHLLPRIHAKDLQGISNNRNVAEAVRKQAFRMLSVRK
ncbi:MAG: hypothetical protein M3209_18770 [Acidobacteriota bacterium]|nr:hypothetical protein [Acidobacteriota bacterium]